MQNNARKLWTDWKTHECPVTLVVSRSIYMTMKTSVLLGVWSRSECVYCTMFLPDVVIPESPEAYVKLTEQTLRSSTGRQQQTKVTSALQRRHTGLVDLCSFLLCTSRCDRQQHFNTEGKDEFHFLDKLLLQCWALIKTEMEFNRDLLF